MKDRRQAASASTCNICRTRLESSKSAAGHADFAASFILAFEGFGQHLSWL
jgi:hypothetical protein